MASLKMYQCFKILILSSCLVEICLIHEVLGRGQHATQAVRIEPKVDKFGIFKTVNDILVLLPPEMSLVGSQIKNQTIKLNAATVFNQETRMGSYGDLEVDESSGVNSRSGARESRKVNLLRGLWSKPRISPLYLVNGTVCRFVNSNPICTTLTTTGIMPIGNNTSTMPVFSRGGLDPFVQNLPNQQQQFTNTNNPQQQFQNTNNPQQQFPPNQQQFPNNPQQMGNQQQAPNRGK